MVPLIKWTDRSFTFNFPVQLFPVIFSRLEGTLFRLAHLLAAADDDKCSYAKKGWSVKEHVGHLHDLEELWWKRLDDFENGKEALTPADMSNAKTHNARHNNNTLERLAQQFIAERQRMLETIFYFDEPVLCLTAFHARLNRRMRLIDVLYMVAEHDDHHLSIISGLLRKGSEY